MTVVLRFSLSMAIDSTPRSGATVALDFRARAPGEG